MDGYTQRQRYFIDIFLQQALRQYVAPAALSESSLADVLDAASSAIEAAQAVTVLAGLVTAIPSAGGGLVAAAAALSVLTVANQSVLLVRDSFIDSEPALLHTTRQAADAKLTFTICMRSAAYYTAVSYRHGLDEKFKDDRSVAVFAMTCANRITQKYISDREKKIPITPKTAESLVNYLRDSVTLSIKKPSKTIVIKDKYVPPYIFISPTYYSKWAAARPRVIAYDIDAKGDVGYVFSKSQDEDLLIRNNTTCEAYGYVVKSKDSLACSQVSAAISVLIPMRKDEAVLPYIGIHYQITAQHLIDYIKDKGTTDISLNEYLSSRLGIHAIAVCHDSVLSGLNLTGGNFSGVDFSRVEMNRCNMSRTKWSNALLDEAVIDGCTITEADFQGVCAEKSHWRNMVMTGNFSSAKLNGAVIQRSKINSCWLQIGVELEWAVLDHVEIDDTQAIINQRVQDQLTDTAQAYSEMKQELVVLERQVEQQAVLLERLTNVMEMDERRIELYIRQRWQDFFSTLEFRQIKARFIEPDVVCSDIPTQRKQVWSVLNEFYFNDQNVLMIHSPTGFGKSLLATLWEDEILHRYRNKTDWLPIYINLKLVSGHENFLLSALKSVYANESTHTTLYRNFRIFFILDGLEECIVGSSRHILEECMEYSLKHWPADKQPKFFILSQTRYLSEKFEDYHQFLRLNKKTLFPIQSEYVLQAFTSGQMLAYRKMYEVEDARFIQRYRAYEAKESAVNLLGKSPFMLHMICELLKQEPTENEHLPSCHVEFYDAMIRNYHQHAQNKIPGDDFTVESLHFYIQTFAFTMFQTGEFWVDKIAQAQSHEALSEAFFLATHPVEHDPILFLFHNALSEKISYFVPVTVTKVDKNSSDVFRYTFMHPSIAYYAIAKKLLTLLITSETFCDDWNYQCLTDFPEILDFLEEIIVLLEKPHSEHPLFHDGLNIPPHITRQKIHEQLLKMVYASKGNQGYFYQKAASNAMSLLSRLRYDFSNNLPRDALCGISIPKADLTRALLAFMNLSKSNLCSAYFLETVLMGANLSGAHLKHAKFLDSVLFLNRNIPIETFASHPLVDHVIAHDRKKDGRYVIEIVSILDETVYATVTGHHQKINAIAWSHAGDLASAGDGAKIRIWQMSKEGQQAKEIKSYKSHSISIVALAWLFDSKFIASVSRDNTLQIWSINQNIRVFFDKASNVSTPISLIWSIKSNRLFLLCADGSLYVWVFSLSAKHDLVVDSPKKIHKTTGPAWSMTLSPD